MTFNWKHIFETAEDRRVRELKEELEKSARLELELLCDVLLQLAKLEYGNE